MERKHANKIKEGQEDHEFSRALEDHEIAASRTQKLGQAVTVSKRKQVQEQFFCNAIAVAQCSYLSQVLDWART
jgi:hypothetical protein